MKQRVIFPISLLVFVPFTSGKMMQEEKDEILNRHNSVRGAVNPPATDMLRMKWDVYMEDLAQAWADKCIFSHPTENDLEYKWTGQNIHITTSRSFSAKKAVDSWHSGSKYYTFSTNKCSHVCEQYTQLVWAKSYKLGCGMKRCKYLAGSSLYGPQIITICQYQEQGNNIDDNPYTTGANCSDCPKTHPHCFKNLCSGTDGRGSQLSYLHLWFSLLTICLCNFIPMTNL